MKLKWLTVAKWEFFEKVRSRAFLLSLVLMPVLVFGIALLPALLTVEEDTSTIVLGVIDQTGRIIDVLQERLNDEYTLKNGNPNYLLRNLITDEPLETLKDKANDLVVQGELEGYFYFPSDLFERGEFEYRSDNVANIRLQERFKRILEKIILEERLQRIGIDTTLYKRIKTKVSVRAMKISEAGEEQESGFYQTFLLAYVGLLMIIFMVLTSGQLLIRSILEEKSNRVVEVLLSSCSAQDLMVGKILGLSGLGLLQMFVYGAFGILIAMKTSTTTFDIGYLLLIVLYAILGYLFYAALLVAAGSPVTTEQEAQQINGYISILIVVPIGFMMLILQKPDSFITTVLSYIPLFTPTVMVLRIAAKMPSIFEIVSTVLILLLSIVGMMWVAGRIFRVAILSYGKRPTFRELILWMRQP
ncbi:MAG: ABC transporter permease [Bacteroidetes bacterium]|nr:ABC transporter permease [Bacteroidota bacterium]